MKRKKDICTRRLERGYIRENDKVFYPKIDEMGVENARMTMKQNRVGQFRKHYSINADLSKNTHKNRWCVFLLKYLLTKYLCNAKI